MCIPNASAVPPLFVEIDRLRWEAELREAEMDRLIKREKKIGHMFHRMQRVLNSNALPEVKTAILKSMCDHGPIFPASNEIQNT